MSGTHLIYWNVPLGTPLLFSVFVINSQRQYSQAEKVDALGYPTPDAL